MNEIYFSYLLQRHAAASPDPSDVSISIENALGAFDFLESEDYEGGYGSSRSVQSSPHHNKIEENKGAHHTTFDFSTRMR